MSEVTASRAVLIEVLTVLGSELRNLVVVGGWVPDLVFPDRGHVGSLDVDLALDAAGLKPFVYESIRNRLTAAGYRQSSELPNRFMRPLPGTEFEVKVDLITGEFPGMSGNETHVMIQGMPVWKGRGIDLAFLYQQEMEIQGVLPGGEYNRVRICVPTVAAFLCIKAITLSERKKEKDAYDIHFCIANYAGGYRALGEEFRGKLNHPLIREGVEILREKFSRIDSIGPQWAARLVEGTTVGMDFDLEMEQRRAFEQVNALLRVIDELGA